MKIKYSFVPVVALCDCVLQSQERSQDFSLGGGGYQGELY